MLARQEEPQPSSRHTTRQVRHGERYQSYAKIESGKYLHGSRALVNCANGAFTESMLLRLQLRYWPNVLLALYSTTWTGSRGSSKGY